MGGKIVLEKARIGKHTEYTYANIGNLYIDNDLGKDIDMQVLDEFLKSNVIELIKESYRVLRDTKKSPYTYEKETFQSKIFMKALVRAIKKGYIIKSPLRVGWNHLNREDSLGMEQIWADYRCRYEGYNYYIEVNKKSVSYESRRLTDAVKKEWQSSCQKLDRMKAQLDANEVKETIGITIEVLNVYVSALEEEQLKYNIERLVDLKEEVGKQFSREYPANWSCLWTLDEEVIHSEEYIHGYEKYPAVLFLVRAN